MDFEFLTFIYFCEINPFSKQFIELMEPFLLDDSFTMFFLHILQKNLRVNVFTNRSWYFFGSMIVGSSP